MTFSFGFKKEEDKQEPDFKIYETTIFNQLPPSISNQFIEVYKIIKSNREYLKEDKFLEIKTKIKENRDILESMKSICMNDIFININSLGHQIDNGIKTIKEFQNDLYESKNEVNDNLSKTYPSPFLIRYSNQIEEASESLSEDIEAYRSHLQSLSNNSNDLISNSNAKNNDILFNFFNEEYSALLRSSTKISQICRKLSLTRSLLCKKLKIDQSKLMTGYEDTQDSVFQSIQTKYKQFTESKKSSMQKSIEDSDLFGHPKNVKAQAAPKPTFTTSSSFVANRTKNNSGFTPPKPIQVNNDNNSITPNPVGVSNKQAPPPTPMAGKKSPFS